MKSIHKKKAIHVLLCRFDKTDLGQSEKLNTVGKDKCR